MTHKSSLSLVNLTGTPWGCYEKRHIPGLCIRRSLCLAQALRALRALGDEGFIGDVTVGLHLVFCGEVLRSML